MAEERDKWAEIQLLEALTIAEMQNSDSDIVYLKSKFVEKALGNLNKTEINKLSP